MTKELLDYFNQDELAASTWLNKYALKDKNGKHLEKTPDDMHRRMAKEFARIEFKYRSTTEVNGARDLSKYGQELWEKQGEMNQKDHEDRIFNLFKNFKYSIPQGSVMSGLGADFIASLSNCVVVESPFDSYGGIMKTDQDLVQLMKRRCGVGFDMSELRPEGTATSNAALTTTGAVSFMHRFSNTTREVAQNGRRGALMLSMHVNHPDSLQFAQIKQDLSKVTGANISVKLTDEFMEAVENDEDFILRFPIDLEKEFQEILDSEIYKEGEYNVLYPVIVKGENKGYTKKIKAKEHWEAIVKAARDVAEPGLLFWDNMVNYSPDGAYPQFKQVSTNPCSEIGMQANDTCRLIAVNFYSFVKNPFTEDAEFDFKKLYEVNYESMRLSDDLVDLEIEAIERIIDKIENDPEPNEVKRPEITLWLKILKSTKEGRRTGLGFTGLGDTLAALGLKYDSEEALEMVEKIMRTKKVSELDSTIDMAILRDPFKGWNPAREIVQKGENEVIGANPYYQFVLNEFPEQAVRMLTYGRRNVSISTVAPTGSLSMLAQVSSGIEPVFSLFYDRRRKVNPNSKDVKVAYVDDSGDSWEQFPVLHKRFEDWVKMWAIEVRHGIKYIKDLSEKELEKYAEHSPYAGATANEIDWQKRVKLQGVVQKYTTHSISSTINLPEDVPVEEVEKIYMAAWKEGLKGITVYREGSRSGVLINKKEEKKEEVTTFHDHHAPRRPKRLFARLVRFNNNKERWIAFVGLLDGKPYEIFTGRLEDIKIPVKIESGEIVKVKDDNDKKRYDFEYEDGVLEGIDRIFSDDFWNYAKMISGTLRHGMPLHFVVDMVSNMSFPDDHINTWKNGVARTLKKFVPDGEAKGLKCYECGDVGNVVFEEGCMQCKSCGSSKCG